MRKILVIQASQVQVEWNDRLFKRLGVKKSVIEYLIARLVLSNSFNVVIATSCEEVDDIFEKLAYKCHIKCIRGELRDVASRLLKVAEELQCENFVRISAYSPLVDLKKLEDMYQSHVKGSYDYSFNEHFAGVPMGMGGDVFSAKSLKKICDMDLDISNKEFVGLYMRQNDSEFRVQKVDCIEAQGGICKLTIETPKDFEVVNEVIGHVGDITVENVTHYLEQHIILSHYNRENPPREAGVEKLLLNEEKVNMILNKKELDSSYPISVELTLTNACNLQCVYCSDLDLRKKQGTPRIELDEFKGLFDDLARGGTKGVVLEGGGEPTIYPFFEEVVLYAKEVGLAVGLITNGTKRLEPEVIKEFEWIRVSLDASTKEEYLKLKGVDVFEQVLSNIALYVDHCKTVGVGYVVTKDNVSQLESLVLRLRMIGASYIQLRPVVDNPDLLPTNLDLNYLKYYQMDNYAVEIGGMEENAIGGNNNMPCYAHSITSVISGDGSVYLCGRLNIYDWLRPIGNIRTQCFRDIWLGEERKKQTCMVQSAEFCEKNCPQCRISKFNSVFDRLYSVKTKHFI